MMRRYEPRREDENRSCGCGRRSIYTNANAGNRRQEETTCPNSASRRNCANNTQEAERMMTMIRRLDFALVETNLYLDTHPTNRAALSYFQRLLKERTQWANRYEAEYGPLTAAGNGARTEWAWSTDAWPWQLDKESKR